MAIDKSNKNARNLAVGFLFILAFIYWVVPLSRYLLGIFMVLLGISIFIYTLKDYQSTIIGISKKNLPLILIISVISGVIFFAVIKYFPAFALLYPSLPQSVGDSLNIFVIVICAPIAEELFFRGSLLGYLRSFKILTKKRIWIALLITSLFFMVFHIVAYSGAISNLQSFSDVFTNAISVYPKYLTALIAGLLFGFLAIKTNNLVASMVCHAIFNIILFTTNPGSIFA